MLECFQENRFAETFGSEEWLQKWASSEDSFHHRGLGRSLWKGLNLTSSDKIPGGNHVAKGNLDAFSWLLGLAGQEGYQHASSLIIKAFEDRLDDLPLNSYVWQGEGPYFGIFCSAWELWEEEEPCEGQSGSTLKMRFTELPFSSSGLWEEKYLALHRKAMAIFVADKWLFYSFQFLRVWPSFSLFNIHQEQGQK